MSKSCPLTHSRPLFSFLSLAFVLASFALAEGNVAREPPAIYTERLEPLLTSIEPLLSESSFLVQSDFDNATLLDERIVFIAEDGTIYEVLHHAYRAMTDGNLSHLSDDIFSYSPDTQNLYLVRAETIQSNGIRIPVGEEGIIDQTPQRAADQSIFTGRKELRLVYPALREGSVTHSILVRETSTHRIPGEWSQVVTWSRNWPTKSQSAIIELPASFAERLRIITFGNGIPEPDIENLAGGRTRWTWRKADNSARRWEPNSAPVTQTGPALFLTTLPDWDAFSGWYSGLLRESSELTDNLRELSAEWVGDASTEDDLIARLFRIAAREIRYTSIDFGYAGLQPQPVDSVWKNGYGDCKDKSNFLRLLLREHGVSAYFGLINTVHSGRVETRSPDYRHFNHAIVVIEREDGSLLFCDPTIKYGWPGLLTPGLADRQVLLIDPDAGGSRWISTPPASGGQLRYSFELDLSRSLELAGWMTVSAEGYYAANLRDRFEARERHSLNSAIERYVRYFFNGAELIDFEEPLPENDQSFKLRAYFGVDPSRTYDDGDATLAWPSVDWLLPDLGTRRQAEREAFVWNDAVSVEMKVRLHDDWIPARMPRALQASTGPFASSGEWSFDVEAATLRGIFSTSLDNPSIPSGEFSALFRAVDAAKSWLAQSPRLTRTGESIGIVPDSSAPLADFKVMPTGTGQLALVDRLYPENRKPEERRQALQKVQQWFSDDPHTQFSAAIRIGWIDWNYGNEEASLAAAQRLLREYDGIVSAENLGWARFLEARSLQDLDRREEALAVFHRLADDSVLSDFRRCWASFYIGKILGTEHPREAFSAYARAFHFDQGESRLILTNLASLALHNQMEAELLALLADGLERYPSLGVSFEETLLALGQEWIGSERDEPVANARLATSLHEVLVEAALPRSDSPTATEERENLERFTALLTASNEVRERVRERIESNPPIDWPMLDVPDTLDTHADFDAAIKQAENEWSPDLAVRLSVERLLRFPADARFPTYLWQAANQADWRERYTGETEPAELFDFLLTCAEGLPLHHDGTIDSYYLRALYWERRNQYEEADATYRWLEELDLDYTWHNTLFTRMGRNQEAAGNCAEALTAYSKLLTSGDPAVRADGILRGTYLLFEKGDLEKAREWIELVASSIRNTEGATPAQSIFLRLNELRLQDHDGDLAFWQVYREWWPAWETLANNLEIAPIAEKGCPVPAVGDLRTFGATLNDLARSGSLPALAEQMRLAAHAARWDPEAMLHLQGYAVALSSILPAYGTEFRRLSVALFESARAIGLPFDNDVRVNYLIALADLGEHQKALETGADFLARITDSPDFIRVVERLGGFVAARSGADRELWVTRLEAQIAGNAFPDREFTVSVLASLYAAGEETEREVDLLESFLATPAGNSSQFQGQFRNRLDALRQRSGDREEAESALNSWLMTAAPAWLRHTPPFNLAGFDESRLGALAQQPPDSLHRLGKIRLLFLIAKDSRVTADESLLALSSLLVELMHSAADDEEWDSLSNALRDDTRLPVSLRMVTLALQFLDAAVSGRPEKIVELQEHPFFPQIEPRIRNEMELYAAYSKVDRLSIASLEGFLTSLETQDSPLDQTAIDLYDQTLKHLLERGALDSARRFIDRFSQIRLDGSIAGSRAVTRLEWTRALRQAERMEPLHAIFRRHFSHRFTTWEVVAEPPGNAPRSGIRPRHYFEPPEHAAFLKWQFENNAFSNANLEFWSDCLNLWSQMDDTDFSEVFSELVQSVENDDQGMEILDTFISVFDFDEVQVRENFRTTVQPLRENPLLSRTADHLRSLELDIRIRSREVADIEAEAAGVRSPYFQYAGDYSVLTAYLARDARNELERHLERMPPSALFHQLMMSVSLEALGRVGLEDEQALAVEQGRELFDRLKGSSIQNRSNYALRELFSLFPFLPGEDLLGDDWIEDARRVFVGDARAELELSLAEMQGNWPEAEQLARAFIEKHHTYYDVYFRLGRAIYKQGRTGEARIPLQIFVKYCGDSPFLPQAERWLSMTE